MSEIRVDTIRNKAGGGAPDCPNGVTVTGVATATSFSGSGANLTGIAVTAYVDSVNITASGIVTVTNTTASTSTTTGALIVSGGVGVAGSIFVGENVSIGGTLTYEDVTNVDSVGLITARAGVLINGGRGVQVTAGGLNVDAGIGTFDAGISVGSAATVYSNATNTLKLGTNSKEAVCVTPTQGLSLNNGELIERVHISGTALNSSTDINLDNGMVHYRSANLGAANVKPNITSSVGINTQMATGDCISVTIITAVNSTSNFVNALMIDHTDVTESWVGGSAPSDGGGSGYDTYAFNILKTGNATYVVIGNQIKTS